MKTRDRYSDGLIYVWVMTVLIWLFTLMAAFVVLGIEAACALMIAIAYSILHRFKARRRWVRVAMVVLWVLITACAVLLAYDIVSAYDASVHP